MYLINKNILISYKQFKLMQFIEYLVLNAMQFYLLCGKIIKRNENNECVKYDRLFHIYLLYV